GGVANIAVDAVYPTCVSITPTPFPFGSPVPLDGNNTYTITFNPSSVPGPSPCPSATAQWPVTDILPPLVPISPTPTPPGSPTPAGFWSIHVYATSATEAAAPFIAQTTLQNLTYSIPHTNLPVPPVSPSPPTPLPL